MTPDSSADDQSKPTTGIGGQINEPVGFEVNVENTRTGQSRTISKQDMENNVPFQIINAASRAYLVLLGDNPREIIVDQNKMTQAIEAWIAWTRSVSKHSLLFNDLTSIATDNRTLRFVDEHNKVNFDQINRVVNFIWEQRKQTPSFKKLVQWVRDQERQQHQAILAQQAKKEKAVKAKRKASRKASRKSRKK